jgi:acetyl esterase/lipase
MCACFCNALPASSPLYTETPRPSRSRQFLGVPFSASTDGANKWLPPQPRAPWDYVLDCSNWGAGCTQAHHNPDVPKNQSLDCLNVNVFAPILPAGATAPVMVFFNGGAFMEGSNQGPFGMCVRAHAFTYSLRAILSPPIAGTMAPTSRSRASWW